MKIRLLYQLKQHKNYLRILNNFDGSDLDKTDEISIIFSDNQVLIFL
jgi:hypothetical protein